MAVYGKGLYIITQYDNYFEINLGFDVIGTIIPDSREEYEEIASLIKSDVDLTNWKDDLGNNIFPNPRVLHFFDDMH